MLLNDSNYALCEWCWIIWKSGWHTKRIIVFLDGQEERVMINPEIINASLEMSTFMEGCLSFPEMYLDIKDQKQLQ